MKDHIKNEDIWREANVEPMTTFLRKKRLRWYGHVLRKEREDTTKKMLLLLLLKYFIYNTSCYKKGSTSKKSLCDHLISIVDFTIYKNTCK